MTSSSPLLSVFYGISSPWAYLGFPKMLDVAAKTGARIELRPIRIIEANGGIPLRSRPEPRQNYHALELRRWRARLEMPLNLKPKFYPCRTIEIAAKSVIAVQAAGLDALGYSFAVQRALWAEDRDIADVGTLQEIARATLGEAGVALVREEPLPEIQAAWEENLAEAERLEIFGTPTYVVEDELFWGQDRLDFVEEKLARITADGTVPA